MCELRAAVYARASSDRQPVTNQLAALRAQVAHDELRVPAEWEFVDDGFGGATLVRPALERLRDLSAKGGLDRLYVESPERLARTYAHQVLLLNELQAARTEVMFVTHLGAAQDGMQVHA
jgi:site-specific DNA recombinase